MELFFIIKLFFFTFWLSGFLWDIVSEWFSMRAGVSCRWVNYVLVLLEGCGQPERGVWSTREWGVVNQREGCGQPERVGCGQPERVVWSTRERGVVNQREWC